MATSARATSTKISTFRLRLHLRATEKLGGVSSFMLFPAPAFHDYESQEQEEDSETQIKNHRTGVDDAARKILHVLDQPKMRKELRPQAALRGHAQRDKAQQKNGDAHRKADHGRNHLAACDGGGKTTQ